MESENLFVALGLPPDPTGVEITFTVITSSGNRRRVITRIESCKLGFGYIELSVSVRKIKGGRIDRLLHRVEQDAPVGEWLALAQIVPMRDEHRWIDQWVVRDLEVVSAGS
jgi:hypothetical protein